MGGVHSWHMIKNNPQLKTVNICTISELIIINIYSKYRMTWPTTPKIYFFKIGFHGYKTIHSFFFNFLGWGIPWSAYFIWVDSRGNHTFATSKKLWKNSENKNKNIL